jgi:hypothetical protein
MDDERITGGPSWNDPRGQVMKTPDDVSDMLRLTACGWGGKRIAREIGCSYHTVKQYVAAGGVKPFKAPQRAKKLDGHDDWLRERFIRHRGCEAFVIVGDDEFDAVQAAICEGSQESLSERLGLRRADGETQDFAASLGVGTGRYYHGDVDDPPTLADLNVGCVDPAIAPLALDGAAV